MPSIGAAIPLRSIPALYGHVLHTFRTPKQRNITNFMIR